jgi:NitT/TauT family transport system permease protein
MKSDTILRAALVFGFVLLLEALCRFGAINPMVMIPPSGMFVSLWKILMAGTFDRAIVLTLSNVALAAIIAGVAGVCVGAVIHALPRVRCVIDPLLTSYYAVPTFLFYPIFILYFGVGRVAITGVAAMMGIVIMIVSTLSGLDHVPTILMRTARVYRMNRWSRAVLIQIPAAAPFIVSGIKLVVAYAFIGVLAAEFIMSGSGIGYSIADAYNEFDSNTMYALMLLVIIIVTVVNGALHVWDRRLMSRRSR